MAYLSWNYPFKENVYFGNNDDFFIVVILS